MGIKFHCPNGHRLNVKSFLAGKKGICPHCGIKVDIPLQSQIGGGNAPAGGQGPVTQAPVSAPVAGGVHPAATTNQTPGAMPYNAGGGSPTTSGGMTPGGAAPMATPWTGSPSPASQQQPTAQPYSAQPVQAQLVSAQPVQAQPAHAQPVQARPVQAQSDPIADAPNAVWYVRPPSGGQFGPASGEIMRKWLGEGRVTADSLVWCEGWPDWKPATSVFPQLKASQQPVQPAAAPAPQAAEPMPMPTGAARPIVRRKGGNGLAIIMIVILLLACAGLLVTFIYVVPTLQTPPTP